MQKTLKKDFRAQYKKAHHRRKSSNKSVATLYEADLQWLEQHRNSPLQIEGVDSEGDYIIKNAQIGEKTGNAYLYPEMFEDYDN